MTTGSQTDLDDGSISDRALNYAFLKEFIIENDVTDEWIEWVSRQLGYTNPQPLDVLIERIDKHIKTSKTGKKFGL